MKQKVKFNQASDANNYEIKNVPFLTTVGENNQLLTCNEENKKIVVDESGDIYIKNNTFNFIITDWYDNDWEFETESGMTWNEWCESEYNSDELYIENNRVKWVLDDQIYIIYGNGYTVLPTEEIKDNIEYNTHTH